MSVEASPEANRAPGVIPAAPWRICALSVLPGFRLSLTFVDGVQGIADLSMLVRSENAGRFAALADPALFSSAALELGAVTWPNGADLDPDWLHEEISKSGEWKPR